MFAVLSIGKAVFWAKKHGERAFNESPTEYEISSMNCSFDGLVHFAQEILIGYEEMEHPQSP
jgi:hypothetical protein